MRGEGKLVIGRCVVVCSLDWVQLVFSHRKYVSLTGWFDKVVLGSKMLYLLCIQVGGLVGCTLCFGARNGLYRFPTCQQFIPTGVQV